MTTPLISAPGPTELILIVLVIVLLFGAKKLPELARGTGRALRIFKAETKGLMDDDELSDDDRPTGELPASQRRQTPPPAATDPQPSDARPDTQNP